MPMSRSILMHNLHTHKFEWAERRWIGVSDVEYCNNNSTLLICDGYSFCVCTIEAQQMNSTQSIDCTFAASYVRTIWKCQMWAKPLQLFETFLENSIIHHLFEFQVKCLSKSSIWPCSYWENVWKCFVFGKNTVNSLILNLRFG